MLEDLTLAGTHLLFFFPSSHEMEEVACVYFNLKSSKITTRHECHYCLFLYSPQILLLICKLFWLVSSNETSKYLSNSTSCTHSLKAEDET